MGSKEKMKEGKKEERKNFGVRRRFPSVSALEFRCCREIPFVDPKLTFDERISCIKRLSSRWSNRTENE